MDSRREPWLIKALEIECRDLVRRKQYQNKTRIALTQQLEYRLFDSFNYLLPQDELTLFAREYFSLLASITDFTNHEGETLDLAEPQALAAHALLRKIIDIGILELLEGPKQIRSDLSKLLNWHDLADKIHQIPTLCAYVGGVFQLIYAKFPKSLEENMLARQCAEKYINKNSKKTIIATLLERNYLTKAEADAAIATPKINESVFSSPAVIAGTTVFSLAALTGLAFGIFTIIKSFSTGNAREEKKEDHAQHNEQPSANMK